MDLYPRDSFVERRSPAMPNVLAVRGSTTLFFHNLPFANQRCLIFAEVDLIPRVVCVFVVYGFDYCVHDDAAVHGVADVVADFVRFGRHAASLAEWVGVRDGFDGSVACLHNLFAQADSVHRYH
jgi:hypothetical protein